QTFLVIVPKPDNTMALTNGIVGFLKGIWYVSATPSCTAHIRAFNNVYLDGSAFAEQTTLGMFEAGGLFLKKRITDRTAVDGLKTMAAANVNNVSVLVSWTMVFDGINPPGPIVKGSMDAAESQSAVIYEATWFPAPGDYATYYPYNALAVE